MATTTGTSPAATGARPRLARGRRAVLSSVTAIVIVLVCAFVAVEAVALSRHRRLSGLDTGSVARFGRTTLLGDSVVAVVAVVAIVIGLILLISAVLPARRGLLELTTTDPQLGWGVSRRSLARNLAAVAATVDGVHTASAVVGRRRIRIQVETRLQHAEPLPEQIRSRVTDRLDALDLARPRPVQVRLRRKDH